MILREWTSPQPGGNQGAELAVAFDGGRCARVLILPALFDEANRLRRLTVEVMRRLDRAGIDCVLPDLPGCNESLTPLDRCDLALWQVAAVAAARQFAATNVLALRGGGLVWPGELPGWHYAPVTGASLLRQLLRARLLASREAGREETIDGLRQLAARAGVELAGHRFGPALFAALEAARPGVGADAMVIDQDMVGGNALWLRAEPDEDREQADALAAIVAVGLAR